MKLESTETDQLNSVYIKMHGTPSDGQYIPGALLLHRSADAGAIARPYLRRRCGATVQHGHGYREHSRQFLAERHGCLLAAAIQGTAEQCLELGIAMVAAGEHLGQLLSDWIKYHL